jgi:ketosteroid isomerase-like protein
MATEHAVEEAGIRERLDHLIDAVRAADLDALRPNYAPDIVTFDVSGPLQGVGVEAKLANWREAFAMFQRPIGYEIRDLTIAVGGDVAFAHGLAKLSATLKNGAQGGGFWVRFTACLRKMDGTWRIAHDHASVPLDMTTSRAAMIREL